MEVETICLDEKSRLIYIPDFLNLNEAIHYYHILSESLEWRREKIKMFGKELWQPRLLAWYADPGVNYTYSGIEHLPLAWTVPLMNLKSKIENYINNEFNSVLANFYRDGKDSMGWHSDDEKELGQQPIIASLSLGASRKFVFRPRKGIVAEKMTFNLVQGSLLIMEGKTQQHFQHALPKTSKPISGRINLTFRRIYRNNI